MLQGLTRQEFSETLLSVGEAHAHIRSLSPVQVADNCDKSLKAGASRKDLSKALQLNSTMVGKFLRLLSLSPEVRHLIDWGRSSISVIGFSTAAELARFDPAEQKEAVEKGILRYALTKEETISIRQLLERSKQPLLACIERVVRRRPTVKVLDVVMGAIISGQLEEKLRLMVQGERDAVLYRVIQGLYPQLENFSVRLGQNRFTVVGTGNIHEKMGADQQFESSINSALASELLIN